MAAGHAVMGIENRTAFFVALAMIIVGNGFFKPNISTMVGSLYGSGNPKRDGGFTIFYMGINLGAAMSPLLCGYIGEKYGWHKGFGLATAGMVIGLAIFVAPRMVTAALIGLGALLGSGALWHFNQGGPTAFVNTFISCALLIAAAIACVSLYRGGLPSDVGAPPSLEALRRPLLGPLSAEWTVYLGALTVIPALALLIQYSSVVGVVMSGVGGLALFYLIYSAIHSHPVERDRLFVVLTLMFFSMLFWAFFEQAGSSISNFTDRNVDRVTHVRRVEASEVGKVLTFEPTQEQLGYKNGEQVFTMTDLSTLRKEKGKKVEWTVVESNVGMGIEGKELPATVFQATNAVFIVVLGLVFTALWSFLASRKLEPSTPVKFALGLMQLGGGFLALWIGAGQADSRGMVWVGWLLLAYLLHTTGELCISPVGLSMVTKLSPKRLVSTVMGAWFLATAFSNYLAGMIATLTGVEGEGKAEAVIPPPLETVVAFASVFKVIAFTAIGSGVICLLLAPMLSKMMHVGVEVEEEKPVTSEIGFSPE
jgi:POT family proton-dependent oligopeptide transporter